MVNIRNMTLNGKLYFRGRTQKERVKFGRTLVCSAFSWFMIIQILVYNMELISICKADVPEYLKQSAFYEALDDDNEDEFTIGNMHFKADAVVTGEDSLRHLLYTLRFWGVDSVPSSILDLAFDNDCSYFTPVASDFKTELRYLDELIQLRTLPSENRLEHACKNGDLAMIQSLISRKSVVISGLCFEAAASGGHLHCIRFLHSIRGKRYWNRISDAAATKGHLSCVAYVFQHTNAFFNAAYGAAKHGHVNILRFIAQHDGKLDKELYEVCLPHLEIVECLYELHVPRWPHGYVHNLIMWNVLSVLRFALSHGGTVHDLYLREAKSVECVQILIEVGGYELNDQSTVYAAQAGLEILKYVHAQGCPVTIFTTLKAVQRNKVDVLQYLHEHNSPWSGYCFNELLEHGSYECLVYMYEHDCPIPLLYKDYFVNPRNYQFCYLQWSKQCTNYLRSQFDFKRKCFNDRNLDGTAAVAGTEIAMEQNPISRSCVIQ